MKRRHPMKTWFLCILTALSFAAFAGCKQADKSDKSDTDPQLELPQQTEQQQGPEIPDEKLPVETDFEQTAEQEITPDNYKAELDKLEQEIHAGN